MTGTGSGEHGDPSAAATPASASRRAIDGVSSRERGTKDPAHVEPNEGLACLLVASTLFVAAGSSVSALDTHFVAQLVVRNAVLLPVSVASFAMDGELTLETLMSASGWAYGRGAFMWVTYLFVFGALSALPFGAAMTIIRASPGLTVIVSRAIGYDHAPLGECIAVFAVTFLGVILIARPFDEDVSRERALGVAAAFCGLACTTFTPILTAKVARCDGWRVVNYAQYLVGCALYALCFVVVAAVAGLNPAVANAASARLADAAPTLRREVWWIVLASLTSFVATSLNAVGYTGVPPGVGSLLTLVEVAMSFGVQTVFFGEAVRTDELVGAALVAAGVVYAGYLATQQELRHSEEEVGAAHGEDKMAKASVLGGVEDGYGAAKTS